MILIGHATSYAQQQHEHGDMRTTAATSRVVHRTTKMSISEKLDSLGSLSLPTRNTYHFLPAATTCRLMCAITSK